MLDLFKLHKPKEDIFPESWIGFGGKNLADIIKVLIKEILNNNKNYSYLSLSKKISKSLGLCVSSVFRYIKQNKGYIPIPILLGLLKFWKTSLNNSNMELKTTKKKILDNVEYLRVNNSSSLKMISPSDVNKNIAYILGAHVADGMLSLHLTFSCEDKKQLEAFIIKLTKFYKLNKGNIYFEKNKNYYNYGVTVNTHSNNKLSHFLFKNSLIKKRIIRVKREYHWKLVDKDKSTILSLNHYLNKQFGIKLIPKQDIGSYRLEMKNKVFARYLILFFGFPYGKKSRIVDEPKIIKKSDLDIRKSFLRGILTFDGGVNKNGSVSLNTYSKYIFDSSKNILLKSGIVHLINGKTARGNYFINSSVKEIQKWLEFFEPNTEKWTKLNGLLYGFKNKVISEGEASNLLDKKFLPSGQTKINFRKSFKIIKDLRNFDIPTYCKTVEEEYGKSISDDVAITNLGILEKCNILKRTKQKRKFLRNKGKMKGTYGAVMKNVFTFNLNITEWRLP